MDVLWQKQHFSTQENPRGVVQVPSSGNFRFCLRRIQLF